MVRHRQFGCLIVVADVVAAQGQGSYGGIAQGIAQLVLLAVVIGVILVLLFIRKVAGRKAANIATLFVVAAVVLLITVGQIKRAKRDSASSRIRIELAKGCAQATRSIIQEPTRDLPIYVRLHGEHLVPKHLRSAIVPSQQAVADGVYFGDAPLGTEDAIQLDLSYRRDLVPGSYTGYERHRVEYNLIARDLRTGQLLATAHDMEARNGFCHGSVEQFLRKALSRREVFWKGSDSGHMPPRRPVPDLYVQGQYGAGENGRYLQSTRLLERRGQVRALFGGQGCEVTSSSISPPVAICATNQIISLGDAIDVQLIGKHRLVAYDIYKGMGFSSLRIEKRSADWQLLYTWEANFAFPNGWAESGEPHSFSFREGGMDVDVYWGLKYEGKQMTYARKAVLNIPLPSL